LIPDRDWAWATVNDYTQSEQLKRHMLRKREGNPGPAPRDLALGPRQVTLLLRAALGRRLDHRLTRPGKAGPTRTAGVCL
jgi:hypothetical protein